MSLLKTLIRIFEGQKLSLKHQLVYVCEAELQIEIAHDTVLKIKSVLPQVYSVRHLQSSLEIRMEMLLIILVCWYQITIDAHSGNCPMPDITIINCSVCLQGNRIAIQFIVM